VDGLDPAIAGSARVIDSGVDGGAGLGGEAFEDGRHRPWPRWFNGAGGDLGGAPYEERVIQRRPYRRQPLVCIHERLGAADPELGEDPGRELVLAERDQQMLCARPRNTPGRRRSDHPAQHLLAGGRPPRPEFELAAETLDRRDHVVDRAGIDALAGKQPVNVPVPGGREQQVFGLDPAVTEHACLVIGQQDRVVCLVGEPAQRVLRPADREARNVARAAAGIARGRQRPPCLGVLLAGLRHV